MDIKPGKTFKLIPPPPECCQVCAANAHGDELPHNRDSWFYQVWFQLNYDRSPTWADASLSCTPEYRAELKTFLEEQGVSTERIGDFQ